MVDAINALELPRYGLGNYVTESPPTPPTPVEAKVLEDLSRAGKRLMGFCRTNLFKRLESSGHAFLLSVERHVLRNFVFMHARARPSAAHRPAENASLRTEDDFRRRAGEVYAVFRNAYTRRFRWLPPHGMNDGDRET